MRKEEQLVVIEENVRWDDGFESSGEAERSFRPSCRRRRRGVVAFPASKIRRAPSCPEDVEAEAEGWREFDSTSNGSIGALR